MENLEYLRTLAIFSKTIDHGSFRAAARALRLSPSVVSHHVTQLEKQLGTALLYRSTRKLSLTPDGERLLISARAMVSAAEQGLQSVTNQSQEPSGLLRVTAPAVLAHSKLVDQLAAYIGTFSSVELLLDFSDARRDLIGDGFDLAIRMGWQKERSFRTRELFEVERKLVASETYLQTRTNPASPKELSEWDWLELTPVGARKVEFQNGTKRVTVQKPSPRISANDAHALCGLARAGAGLAVVPKFLTDADVASGALRYVLSKWSVSSVRVFAAWPANAPRHGLIEHFVSFLSGVTQKGRK